MPFLIGRLFPTPFLPSTTDKERKGNKVPPSLHHHRTYRAKDKGIAHDSPIDAPQHGCAQKDAGRPRIEAAQALGAFNGGHGQQRRQREGQPEKASNDGKDYGDQDLH